MASRLTGIALAALVALTSSFTLAAVQTDTMPEAVRALVTDVAAAYRTRSAYADAGRVERRLVVQGRERAEAQDVPLRFARPNRLAIEIDGVAVTSDGTKVRTRRNALRNYRDEPCPAELRIGSLESGALGSVLRGGPAEHPVGIVLSLLISEEAPARLLENVTQARLEPGTPFPGVDKPLTAVILDRGPRPTIRLGIDEATKQIRAIDLVTQADALSELSPPGTTVTEWTVQWRSGVINDAVPDDAFMLTVPAGMAEVKAAAARPAAAAGGGEASPLVGKPSPAFALTILEGPEKTSEVTAAELKGKVVVLDFWATWCPPCRDELPEIQALVERLQKTSPDGVLVVAVSQDRAPDDGAPVRDLVEKSLAELKTPIAGGTVGRVAIDAEQAVGGAFEVQGIPTIVVIDAAGVVRHMHVGYEPGIGDRLAEEIADLIKADLGR